MTSSQNQCHQQLLRIGAYSDNANIGVKGDFDKRRAKQFKQMHRGRGVKNGGIKNGRSRPYFPRAGAVTRRLAEDRRRRAQENAHKSLEAAEEAAEQAAEQARQRQQDLVQQATRDAITTHGEDVPNYWDD